MPMQSQSQRAYLWIHEPQIAKRFEAETPKGKKLPKYKSSNALQRYFGGLIISIQPKTDK